MNRAARLVTFILVGVMTVACSGSETPTHKVTPPSSVAKALPGTPPNHVLKSVKFSGYRWQVTNRPRGVPPTTVGGFSGRHAWVDDQGRLNLRLERIGRVWQGGALVSRRRGWGYGTYRWTVEGRVDNFHRNVVMGLFTYEQGAPGNREIDIEISRFGRSTPRPNISSTLYPRRGKPFTRNWGIGYQARTTHAFTWTPGRVTWTARGANNEIIHRTQARTTVRPGGERVHMNLWICCNRAPNRPQHVIISSFTFQPYTRS